MLTFAGVAQQMGWAMPADFLCISHMKKPLDHCVWTNMTGTDDQLHHWFGASGRLHGHFNVQDCISRWRRPNPGKVFFASQSFRDHASLLAAKDRKPPQQTLGRRYGCQWSWSLELNNAPCFVRCKACNDGRGKLVPKTFVNTWHVLTALLDHFVHFSFVPLG